MSGTKSNSRGQYKKAILSFALAACPTVAGAEIIFTPAITCNPSIKKGAAFTLATSQSLTASNQPSHHPMQHICASLSTPCPFANIRVSLQCLDRPYQLIATCLPTALLSGSTICLAGCSRAAGSALQHLNTFRRPRMLVMSQIRSFICSEKL